MACSIYSVVLTIVRAFSHTWQREEFEGFAEVLRPIKTHHTTGRTCAFDPITQPATGRSGTAQQRIKPKLAEGGVSRLNASQMGCLVEMIQQFVASSHSCDPGLTF